MFGKDKADELLLQITNDPESSAEPLAAISFVVETMKANVNVRDSEGRTPIFGLFNVPMLGRYLIAKGADVFIKDDHGQTVLQVRHFFN